jgi:hypothetical protein
MPQKVSYGSTRGEGKKLGIHRRWHERRVKKSQRLKTLVVPCGVTMLSWRRTGYTLVFLIAW